MQGVVLPPKLPSDRICARNYSQYACPSGRRPQPFLAAPESSWLFPPLGSWRDRFALIAFLLIGNAPATFQTVTAEQTECYPNSFRESRIRTRDHLHDGRSVTTEQRYEPVQHFLNLPKTSKQNPSSTFPIFDGKTSIQFRAAVFIVDSKDV